MLREVSPRAIITDKIPKKNLYSEIREHVFTQKKLWEKVFKASA